MIPRAAPLADQVVLPLVLKLLTLLFRPVPTCRVACLYTYSSTGQATAEQAYTRRQPQTDTSPGAAVSEPVVQFSTGNFRKAFV